MKSRNKLLLLLSRFSRVRLCATPNTAAHKAPRSLGFSRQETGVGCHFLLQGMKGKVKGKSLSHVRLFTTPWTAAHQAPPSMGFSRQGYRSGCHRLLRETWCRWSYLQSRNRDPEVENRRMRNGRERERGWIGRTGFMCIHCHALLCMEKMLIRTYRAAQGTLLCALRQPKWEENQKERGYTDMCKESWFTSLYNRNQHNIVKQLYFKKFIKNTFIC